MENRLRKYGNQMNETDLLRDFMTIWPTFNIATIMTAVMVPKTGFHNTSVWYSTNPTEEQSKPLWKLF